MPRAKLGHVSDEYAMKLLTEHHIAAFRRAKDRSREITQVRHVQFGWMKPADYYRLGKIHDLLPLLEKAIEGGYRVQAAILSTVTDIVIGPITIPIPIGPALAGASALELAQAIANQDVPEILHAGFKLFGPFGAIVQIVESVEGALRAFAPPAPAEKAVFIVTVLVTGVEGDPKALPGAVVELLQADGRLLESKTSDVAGQATFFRDGSENFYVIRVSFRDLPAQQQTTDVGRAGSQQVFIFTFSD